MEHTVKTVVQPSHLSGASGQEPRHGKLTGHLGGHKGRHPNFHKRARPAYEQEALPTLSLLPGDVAVKVLPGDKMHQAVEVEPDYMVDLSLEWSGRLNCAHRRCYLVC